jgi:sugar lactone lactonase YvrE
MSEERSLGGRDQRSARLRRMLPYCAVLVAMAQISVLPARAQGPVLRVQPGDTAQRLAGTADTVGYSGDGSAATSAKLASPAAVAYDSAGNLYIADAQNHVIREVSTAGIVTTVAGTGVEGFGGDGGPATAALLDTPTGVAVDASGNLYIADSHNQRIREVSQGTITTIAGNGTAGFFGDGSAATAAMLFLPQAVAVDPSGNVYIADTGNFRIRKVSGGTITTIAGDGEQIYSGDGGPATSAGLDTPTGVAVDANGNLYIADSHNQRVREVSGGTIHTVAGNGTLGYSGDSAAAASAALATPRGVSVDASGNLYIADTENNVVREVSGGVINTIAGTGIEGYSGDNGAAVSAIFDTPRAVAPDAVGDVAVADSDNDLVRAVQLPTLAFGSQAVGSMSAAQSLTLSNAGSASMQVQSLALTGSFALASGGSCGAVPITVAAGSSCTVQVAFAPAAEGSASGSVVVSGAGLTPQTILLTGTGLQGADALTLTGTQTSVYGGAVSLTATLTSGSQVATGTVTFTTGSTTLGTVALVSDAATLNLSTLPAGSYSIVANYSGDANYPPAVSAAFTLVVAQGNTTTILNISGGSTCGTGLSMLTATVTAPAGMPTGTVTFFNGSTQLGTATLNSAGQASLTPSMTQLASGISTLTAVYAGNANFSGSASVPTMNNSGVSGLQGGDFSISIANGGSSTQTVALGSSAIFLLTIAPRNRGTLSAPVALSVLGLPSGASCGLNPNGIPAGFGATTASLMIQVPLQTSANGTAKQRYPQAPMALGFLLLPLAGLGAVRRRAGRLPRLLLLFCIAMLGASMVCGLNGCGGGAASSQSAKQGTTQAAVTVIGTSGSVVHSIPLSLSVE